MNQRVHTLFIIVEALEEYQQFLLVPSQNGFNLRRFLWIRDEDLRM